MSAAAQNDPYFIVLGVAQDAGHPQAGCQKSCCAAAWEDPSNGHNIASLGIVDPATGQRWLLDASPDLPVQWAALNDAAKQRRDTPLSGILLTHAHIGHYTGLMYLGHESTGAKGVPVYAMDRMAEFLGQHGPWEQLVSLKNIQIQPLKAGMSVQLSDRVRATAFLVPHRDEYSETVGFLIEGPNHSVLYLPDVDKWERMTTPIESLIAQADYAFLDGTFFSDDELPGRTMSDIPHPFIQESLARFKGLKASEKSKIYFTHFNHTNPALNSNSAQSLAVQKAGFHLAEEGTKHGL